MMQAVDNSYDDPERKLGRERRDGGGGTSYFPTSSSPQDGGSMFLSNVGIYLRGFTTQGTNIYFSCP